MKIERVSRFVAVVAVFAACAPPDPAEEVLELVESARTIAGADHQFVFGELCEGPFEAVGAPPAVSLHSHFHLFLKQATKATFVFIADFVDNL